VLTGQQLARSARDFLKGKAEHLPIQRDIEEDHAAKTLSSSDVFHVASCTGPWEKIFWRSLHVIGVNYERRRSIALPGLPTLLKRLMEPACQTRKDAVDAKFPACIFYF
jgi:hypothetical protein